MTLKAVNTLYVVYEISKDISYVGQLELHKGDIPHIIQYKKIKFVFVTDRKDDQKITQSLAYGGYIDSTEHSIDIKNILHRILTDRKDYYFIKPKGDMITKQITKTYVMVQNTNQGQDDKTRHHNCGVS